MIQEIFLIDSNSFITPHQKYYPFDFAPNFWKQMEHNIDNGRIAILDVVKTEILKGTDDLTAWMKDINIKNYIDRRESAILTNYGLVLQYVQDCDYYKQSALHEWADGSVADPWLIAVAMLYNYTIVTFETPNTNPNLKLPWRRAKIPEVAEYFGVKTIDLFSMMRALNFKL